MKIKYNLFLLAVVLLFGFTVVRAQTGTPPTVSNLSGLPPSASSIKAAEDMLIASGASIQFDKNINAIITQYSAQVPEAKRTNFVEVMSKFLNKYISWDILKPELCKLYAHEFTEPELKQLTAFYKTPLGMKLNERQPILIQAGMGIGQQAVIAHQDELQQMMAEAMK